MARLTRLALLLVLSLGTACQPYHGTTTFDDGPQIGEHGISVPVPPPSLTAAPRQTVEVEGDLRNPVLSANTFVQLRVYNRAGDWETARSTMPGADGHFLFDGDNAPSVDLTNNCIEVWSEDEDGEDMRSFYVASIAEDDQTIVTTQYFNGCIQ